MSVVGTSIASSVAQAPVQTQQVAGARDKADAESAHDARNIRDLFQSQVESLEEDQRDEDAPTNPHIDKQLSQGHADTQTGRQKARRRQNPGQRRGDEALLSKGSPNPAATSPAAPPTPAQADSPDSPLYRHLDVQG